MNITQWMIAYRKWHYAVPAMASHFDAKKITMLEIDGTSMSFDVDGIHLKTTYSDDETKEAEVLEVGLPYNRGLFVDPKRLLTHTILVIATLESESAVSKENLRAAVDISGKVWAQYNGMMLRELHPINVHTSDKYNYVLEGKLNEDGKVIISFTGKKRTLNASSEEADEFSSMARIFINVDEMLKQMLDKGKKRET